MHVLVGVVVPRPRPGVPQHVLRLDDLRRLHLRHGDRRRWLRHADVAQRERHGRDSRLKSNLTRAGSGAEHVEKRRGRSALVSRALSSGAQFAHRSASLSARSRPPLSLFSSLRWAHLARANRDVQEPRSRACSSDTKTQAGRRQARVETNSQQRRCHARWLTSWQPNVEIDLARFRISDGLSRSTDLRD